MTSRPDKKFAPTPEIIWERHLDKQGIDYEIITGYMNFLGLATLLQRD